MGDPIEKLPTDLAQCDNYNDTISTIDSIFDQETTAESTAADDTNTEQPGKPLKKTKKHKPNHVKDIILCHMKKIKPVILATIMMVILNLTIIDAMFRKAGLDHYLTVLAIKTIFFFLIMCIVVYC